MGEVSVGGWIEVVVPAALGHPTPAEPPGGFQSHQWRGERVGDGSGCVSVKCEELRTKGF